MPYVEIINGDQVPPINLLPATASVLPLIASNCCVATGDVTSRRSQRRERGYKATVNPLQCTPGLVLQSNSADGGAVCFEPSAINRSYGIG